MSEMILKDESVLELRQAVISFSDEVVQWKSQCKSLESILHDYQSVLGHSAGSCAAPFDSEKIVVTPTNEQKHLSINSRGSYTSVSPPATSERTMYQEFRIGRNNSEIVGENLFSAHL